MVVPFVLTEDDTMNDLLADHRRHLLETLYAESQQFDKAVMTLAAGALGISIAFVNNVAPDPRMTEWLAASWVLLALSLLCVLVSFIASQAAIRWDIDHLYDDPRPQRPRWRRLTPWFNAAAAATFVGGIGALTVFALLNLGRGHG
jgi:hypothetical protein